MIYFCKLIKALEMDSLTQIVLGAAVGEAVAGRKVGIKAAIWGAIGGTIPDLDIIPVNYLEMVRGLEIHRGFSHSILFSVLFAPIFGWLIAKIYGKKDILGWKGWSWLMFWALFTHPLLDCNTTWGTQLFWPFEYRVAFKNIFVVDPLYTFPFITLLILALRKPKESAIRRRLNHWGLYLSSFYLLWTFVAKFIMVGRFEDAMIAKGMDYQNFSVKPMPLNTVLWTANIETPNAFYIGLHSFMDKDRDIEFLKFDKNEHLLAPYKDNELLQRLLFMTQHFYTVEEIGDDLLINDLRFGIAEGWEKGDGDFVFRYRLIDEGNGTIRFVQEENNVKSGAKMLGPLWDRIWGQK